MAGFVKGQALSGMFAALMQIFSLSLGESATESGLIYFSIGNLLCFSSLIGYLILIKSPFCTYHLLRAEHQQNENLRRSFSKVFKKMWVDNVSAMLVFGVTLMVYPAVSSLIESEYKKDGGVWPNRYFTPVICFLLFTTCDFIGRCIAAKYEWVSYDNEKYISFLTVVFYSFRIVPVSYCSCASSGWFSSRWSCCATPSRGRTCRLFSAMIGSTS